MDDKTFLNSFQLLIYNNQIIHSNDDALEKQNHRLGYVIQGSGLLTGYDVQIKLDEGDMFYIPKGYKYHFIGNSSDVHVRVLSFGFFPSTTNYPIQKLFVNSSVQEALRSLLESYQSNADTIGKFYILLGLIMPSMIKISSDEQNQIIKDVIEYMWQHPCAKMPDVAVACGISTSTLYRLFKTEVDKTPNAVRQEVQCQKAASLLTTTTLSVEKICRLLGFSSSVYFRKVFHSHYGMSPREYRKANRFKL